MGKIEKWYFVVRRDSWTSSVCTGIRWVGLCDCVVVEVCVCLVRGGRRGGGGRSGDDRGGKDVSGIAFLLHFVTLNYFQNSNDHGRPCQRAGPVGVDKFRL